MIEPDLAKRLDEIEMVAKKAADEATAARRYLMWGAILAVALFVFPLIGILFAIPAMLTNYIAPLTSF